MLSDSSPLQFSHLSCTADFNKGRSFPPANFSISSWKLSTSTSCCNPTNSFSSCHTKIKNKRQLKEIFPIRYILKRKKYIATEVNICLIFIQRCRRRVSDWVLKFKFKRYQSFCFCSRKINWGNHVCCKPIFGKKAMASDTFRYQDEDIRETQWRSQLLLKV